MIGKGFMEVLLGVNKGSLEFDLWLNMSEQTKKFYNF